MGSNTDAASSMLPVPFTLLGARRYLSDVSGESSTADTTCGHIREQDWLNNKIIQITTRVTINAREIPIASSAFVAVASECSGCLAGAACSMEENVNNQCDTQRRHLDMDISRWYQAYEPSMYNEIAHAAFRGVVQRIGTGPWGAGVWWGDSQQYFLAVWLATSLLRDGKTLDYFLYDYFCENPGNQCFLLGADGCAECITRSQSTTGIQASHCGATSVYNMVSTFKGQSAMALYEALTNVGKPPSQIFDLLK